MSFYNDSLLCVDRQGKRKDHLSPSAFYFLITAIFIGIPSGSLWGGESYNDKIFMNGRLFPYFNSTTTACMYGRTFYFTRSFITRACTWRTSTKEFFSSTWLTTDHMWTTSNKVLRKKKRSRVFSKLMSRSGVTLFHTARVAHTCLWIIKLLHDIEILSVVQ